MCHSRVWRPSDTEGLLRTMSLGLYVYIYLYQKTHDCIHFVQKKNMITEVFCCILKGKREKKKKISIYCKCFIRVFKLL